MNHNKVIIKTLESIIRTSLTNPLSDLDKFRFTHCNAELTRKMEPGYDDGAYSKDTLALNAQDTFLSQERINRETNIRLNPLNGQLSSAYMQRILHTAGRLVVKVIGHEPDIKEVLNSASHGPGVTLGCAGRSTSYYYKSLSRLTITKELLPFGRAILASDPALAQINSGIACVDPSGNVISYQREPILCVHNGGELFTVPKDNTTDRICEKQPTLNVFIQKGIGSIIRDKLLKVGVYLRDQSYNRSLAMQGSLNNELATVDLSNASNSITLEIVRQLLPPAWFHLLNICRTREVVLLDGSTVHQLNMFSAMGNGFTFELESLIFWAITRATRDIAVIDGDVLSDVISVYGDDIICPSGLQGHLPPVLSFCGFQTNSRKTYWSGPFRESCGGDYYMGNNVKPLRIRRVPSTLVEYIELANKIRARALDWGEGAFCHLSLFDAWSYITDVAISKGALTGPMELEGVIHIDNESFPSSLRHYCKDNHASAYRQRVSIARNNTVKPHMIVALSELERRKRLAVTPDLNINTLAKGNFIRFNVINGEVRPSQHEKQPVRGATSDKWLITTLHGATWAASWN